jgi:hypothetical protein
MFQELSPRFGSLVICPGVYPPDRYRSQPKRKTPKYLAGVTLGMGNTMGKMSSNTSNQRITHTR